MTEPQKKRRRPANSRSNALKKPWEPSARDLEIYHRVIEGRETQAEIGKSYGITKQRVFTLKQQINAWLVPRHLEAIKETKAEHVERLMHIYTEAMRAWENSKGEHVTHRKGDTAKGSIDMKETKTLAGDPRFLSEARGALKEIREIVGANAPLKVEHLGMVRVAGREPSEIRAEFMQRVRDMASVGSNN